MSDERERIGIRTSATLRGVVAGYGELSAATKALLIVGAVELGTPVQLLKDDIAALLGASLLPNVRTRLIEMFNRCSTDVQQLPQPQALFQSSPPPLLDPSDPYAGVGQDI